MALLQFTLVFGNDHFVLPVPAPETYFIELENRHVNYTSAADAIRAGYKACEVLREGGDVGLLAANVVDTIGTYRGLDAAGIVAAAALHLCPDQRATIVDYMHDHGHPEYDLYAVSP